MAINFNFGPIGRTAAGGRTDTFNLATVALHATMNALMAATNRDEFVAWLWHDLLKPAFYWTRDRGNLRWIHIPGRPPFQPAEAILAQRTGIPVGIVSTHHDRKGRRFRFGEAEIIKDQFEQTGLGRSAHFLQLSFAVEPAMTTAALRAVIEDSFIETIVQDVAESLRQVLSGKHPSFSRVRFVFETCDDLTFSSPPTDSEIWSMVGRHFHVEAVADELVLKHLTPVVAAGRFDTELTVDLSGRPLTPEEAIANVVGLGELLVVYQDSRTVIMATPQPGIYKQDLDQIVCDVLELTRSKLRTLDIRVQEDGVDLLQEAFATQIEVRALPCCLGSPPDPRNPRPMALAIGRPAEQLENARAGARRCCLCGSFFTSDLPVLDMTRPDFTDAEHIGLTGDVCPLCRVYWCNTHQYRQEEKGAGSTGMRKALRGSFAIVLPSSCFDLHDRDCHLVERPPLDVGGRFSLAGSGFRRVTVTQQEFVCFTLISRRIVAQLWRRIEPVADLPLPYLGGVLLTHREADVVRKLLPALRGLFDSVTLQAYPYEAQVVPSVELALEVALTDLQKHHTKHTYLKSRPMSVAVHSAGRVLVLADNAMQIEISRSWFEACDRVAQLTQRMSYSQRAEWMRRMAEGADPITAYYEATLTRLKQSNPGTALNWTAAFWTEQYGPDPAKAWSAYEREREELSNLFSRYPMLATMFPLMVERKEAEDAHTEDTASEANGSGAERSAGRSRQSRLRERARRRR